MLDPFEEPIIPLDQWAQTSIDWLAQTLRPFFLVVRLSIGRTLERVESFLISVPPPVFLAVLFLIAWQVASLRVAVFVVLAMTFIGLIGVWKATMTTIALIVTAVLFSLVVGIPLGIWAGRSDRFEALIRPILDIMQTLPAFVYLVPIVMFMGIGNVPGVVVTVVFAVPPVVRLTSLGIRQVPKEVVEAAYAFGSSPRQVLIRVQIPLAFRTIMAGVNQTLMMALAMVTIASMIAVAGLGQLVLRGVGRLDMGLATIGGIGIVLLAMILDRMTQAVAAPGGGGKRWTRHGPIGVLLWLWYSMIRHHGPATTVSKS